MGTFIRKLIPNNIAGIIGIAQTLIPLIRELVIAGIRIVDVLTPNVGLEPIIKGVVATFNRVEALIIQFKNMFLGI